MKNVLVTGGCGFIGSHTVVELINRGYNVTVIDNLVNSSKKVIKRLQRICGAKPAVNFVDVRSRVALEDIFASQRFDSVIHFAGLKAVGESCQMPLEYYHNNLVGTLVLLQTMKKYDVKKIVFSSSATVYGSPERLPLDEECSLSTTNPYGTTKLMQEMMFRDLYKSDNSWTVALLRYFNPVGAHESGLIGEDPKGIPNNLMPYVARVAGGRLDKVTVFGNDYDTPDGTGVRDYIHVVDLAVGHIAAIEKITEPGVYTYNLGTGNGSSVLEIIKAFEKASGKTVPYTFGERRSGDIAACYADASKAEKELGWKAKRGLYEMCASMWKWQDMNPDGYDTALEKTKKGKKKD